MLVDNSLLSLTHDSAAFSNNEVIIACAFLAVFQDLSTKKQIKTHSFSLILDIGQHLNH